MNKTTLTFLCVALLFISVGGVFAQQAAPSSDVTIHVRDYCDPDSFNAAVGPGTCVRGSLNPVSNGAIVFPAFVGEVTLDKSVGAWRFVPGQLKIAQGATLHLQNLGGEFHTFTEVKRFGGGFVDFLNALSGNPVPAPECAQVVNGQLVPQPPGPDNIFLNPGDSVTLTEDKPVARYQCCVHPWMRVTITPMDQHHQQVH